MSVTLHGWQDTGVAAHDPETAGAALSVRVGGALIWMNDRATVTTFAQTWLAEGYGARHLPRAPSGDEKAVRDVAEPRVMVEASGSPAVSVRYAQDPGRPARMWVVLGRIAFDVRDYQAFKSTTVAFRRAEEVAGRVFLFDGRSPVPESSPLARAAEVGSRAFVSPVGSPYQHAVRARTVPAAVRDPQERRPERGGLVR